MKIVACTDVHASASRFARITLKVKKEEPDVVVCCGDFSLFEQGGAEAVRCLARLRVPVVLVRGNHERESFARRLCGRYRNVSFLHKRMIVLGGFAFVGYGGGGFSLVDPEFREFAANIAPRLRNKQ